jgi:4-hydroxy-tetrahydrodipicolinate reductase
MTKPIRVLVSGATGKMGQETVKALMAAGEFLVVAQTSRQDNLTAAIQQSQADVVVDFTVPAVAFDNALAIIEAGARPVIGTTGISTEQVEQLKARCAEKKLGGIIAPNFAIGAILAMKYAQDCARYFPNVEIIELHHNQKMDAPSGTALRAAELIAAVKTKAAVNLQEKETIPGVRGGRHHEIPIHSVRLPGLLAHQAVMFGDTGEVLTIRHDATNRTAYMPGVCLACRKVMALDHLVYGLEHIL